MKKVIMILWLVFILASCSSVENKSSDQVLNWKQEQIMKEVNAQVWMPWIVNFQEKKLAKMIFELRDQEKLLTYSYLKNEMTWKLVFLCKSIGYGLPYSVQYTSPQKLVSNDGTVNSFAHIQMPQADPNGLFMPEWLSATWVMCINPKTNNPQPVYIESDITVSPFEL